MNTFMLIGIACFALMVIPGAIWIVMLIRKGWRPKKSTSRRR